ncbi:DUF7415 domain-containing protein [Klebsiella pneumoniae]|uniref:DUF7415 domain-containing protein n=1 Tax=Klebsiella pneumoniae TaxID=573 RepID=UPI001CBC9286|nr:hypothetical protein [Klebsiella pneumoniae]EKX7637446.1 hypothetical protein [Klebsiella pneumoniae]ELA1308055.1 hypothetical protein [Klebsiella pneumoniae]MBZ1696842.1 hypothetical protein [Klebsiella pneumoniae]HDZ2531274.1 hypothetical protein [Klebsiella pneumoniae]HDZ2539746.1 hypothetical protein [Klebsiella pneumoniae]
MNTQKRRLDEEEVDALTEFLRDQIKFYQDDGQRDQFVVSEALLKALVEIRERRQAEAAPAPEKINDLEYVDWNELSRRGLLERINREVLHPLGLAAFRYPDTGQSGGALISPDGVWTYAQKGVYFATPNDLAAAIRNARAFDELAQSARQLAAEIFQRASES